ncbi:MAG: Ig-like domain-containing protein [Planctomycetes bacterium]|nr:Ig-like domain-containing protein [Planctomycetota bacterium]
MTATATLSDSTTSNVTSSVTWGSSDSGIASVNSSGLVTGVSAGTATISALHSSGKEGSQQVTVTSATVISIAVTPTTPSIATGATQQMVATATLSDSSTQDVTNSVTWSSDQTSIATVGAGTGLVTGVSAGTANITATHASSSVSGSTMAVVTAPTLSSITVSPASANILVGATQAFTATGTYSDSSTQDLTSSVTWMSDNTSVASFSGATLTGNAAGSVTVTATDTASSISGTASVTVSASVSFSSTILPIFQSRCITCHPGNGGLDLSSYAGISAGGNSGPAYVAGDSANSRIVKRVEGTIQPRMPQGQSALTSSQIQNIKDWIDQGANNN